MPGIICSTFAALSDPYHHQKDTLSNQLSNAATDPRIVMAEQISQDVVKQEQSVDGSSSTDVSAAKTTIVSARAVLENASEQSSLDHEHPPSSLLPAETSNNQESLGNDEQKPTWTSGSKLVTVSFPMRIDSSHAGAKNMQGDDASVNEAETSPPFQLPTVNGKLDNAEGQEFEAREGSIRSVGVDGSVGSDTEINRTDNPDGNGKDLEDGLEHTRPNAIKKAASFKPVSVTKNFLAKAGTATTPVLKAGTEKGMR
jgi:hypothetical protein